MVKDTKWHVAWIQLSWRKMLHSACSRGKSSLRAELQFSRVIYPNSHVLLSHRPWWWGRVTQILCCRTICTQSQTSHQSQDPLHEGCYAAQRKQRCFALGLEWHPVAQWLQSFLLEAENSQVLPLGCQEPSIGMGWHGMEWDPSMGCLHP